MADRKFTTFTREFNYDDQLQKTPNINSIEFYNAGTANAYVNTRLIPPGVAWAVNGDVGEVNDTTYKMNFDSTGTKRLQVTVSNYMN